MDDLLNSLEKLNSLPNKQLKEDKSKFFYNYNKYSFIEILVPKMKPSIPVIQKKISDLPKNDELLSHNKKKQVDLPKDYALPKPSTEEKK